MAFSKNALFKSYGVIFGAPLPSKEMGMASLREDYSFIACRDSDSSYDMTDLLPK